MEKLSKKIIQYYEEMILSDDLYENGNNNGGKIRYKNGNLVESIVRMIIDELCLMNNITTYKITGKSDDSIRINSKNGYIDVSVDVHLSINNESILFSECKTYLDKCYLDRANSDLSHFKKLNKVNHRMVVSLENAVSDNAENFFLDEGNIDKIFYLLDGKRSSKKPIWKKKYYKPINNDVLIGLIEYIDDIIKQYI
jgi:hypothetical protein